MTEYVAGIDIGTTGSKAIIIDLEGNKISSAYREYGCTYPQPNWVEQDADELVRAAMNAMKETIETSGIAPEAIKAVSLSAQRCCGIFLDKDGKQLRPMISWLDNRGTAEITELEESLGADNFREKTGFPLGSTWLISKIMWYKKNQPELWNKTAKIVQMHDYFLHALGVDDYFVDLNDAGFFGLYSTEKHQWDQALLDLVGIDQAMLPIPAAAGTQCGKVSAKASELSGLAAGTVIAIGTGDQSAGSLGAGIVESGNISISMGTAGALNACLDSFVSDPNGAGLITCHTISDKWLWEGHQNSAAGVYRWFRDEVAALEREQAAIAGKDYYQLMSEKVAEIPAGAKGLLFLPYLAGAATPRFNSSARGTLLGLTFAHDRFCMARAIMEGITLDMRDVLESLKKTGNKVESINILGGPTYSEVWNQIQCDVYGVPVSTLNITDATLLGAGILAAVGAGIFGSIAEAATKMVRKKKTYQPDMDNHETYNKLYELYCDTYDSLNEKEVFSRITDLQS